MDLVPVHLPEWSLTEKVFKLISAYSYTNLISTLSLTLISTLTLTLTLKQK